MLWFWFDMNFWSFKWYLKLILMILEYVIDWNDYVIDVDKVLYQYLQATWKRRIEVCCDRVTYDRYLYYVIYVGLVWLIGMRIHVYMPYLLSLCCIHDIVIWISIYEINVLLTHIILCIHRYMTCTLSYDPWIPWFDWIGFRGLWTQLLCRYYMTRKA